MEVSDDRSSTAPSVVADWSSVALICLERSVILDRNDLPAIWVHDRAVLEAKYPIEHEDICWLGKNYASQPSVWRYGCDRGCVARAAKLRR